MILGGGCASVDCGNSRNCLVASVHGVASVMRRLSASNRCSHVGRLECIGGLRRCRERRGRNLAWCSQVLSLLDVQEILRTRRPKYIRSLFALGAEFSDAR